MTYNVFGGPLSLTQLNLWCSGTVFLRKEAKWRYGFDPTKEVRVWHTVPLPALASTHWTLVASFIKHLKQWNHWAEHLNTEIL